MADNQQPDNSGNIYVEFDYNNIILVDPNRTIDNQGRIYERLVDHENLIMFANLEAEVIPRTKLAVGFTPNDTIRNTTTIARMNFLRPTKNTYLSTGYYDDLTGRNALQQQATNQPLEKVGTVPGTNRPYYENTVVDEQNVIDSGLLGITSINVKVSSSFIPSVTMELEDIQGKALFQLGNKSPYSAFFNLPYPQFYLTLKGYYGQAIRYQLNLEKFNARFNSATGNYSVTLEFRGFKFNILNEVLISHLFAAPHMYSKVFDIKTTPIIANTSTTNANLQKQASTTQLRTQNSSSAGNTEATETLVSEGGYQKIVEVYKEYKAKKLIPEDFPELTLVQLMNKLDTFEQLIKNTYPAANIEPLTDIRNYKLALSGFFDKIRGGANSWFTRYLNPKPIVLKNNTNVYRFKDNILNNIAYEKAAVTNLNNLIKEFVKALESNQTLGKNKPEQIKIDNLSYEMMTVNLTVDQVDFVKTAQSSLGVSSPTSGQTRQIEEEFIVKNKPIRDAENPSVDIPRTYFVFEATGRFTETVQKLDTEANKKLQQFEKAITEDLKSQIEQQATGIGFVPSVRNIVAVIMATAEGFIRLLDEVHTKAWDVKTDPVRRIAIQENPSSANRLEQNKNFNITAQAQNQNQGLSTGLEPVYPWPTFYKENTDFKKGRFQLTYVADPSVVQTTNGLNAAIWPEVEFVEEYIKGLAQKFNPPISQSPFDSNNTTFITNFNPLLFPSPILSYSNKIEVPFFYELYERQLVTSHYLGYVRADSNQLTQLTNLNRDTEASNILLSLGVSSPYLTNKLKNTPLSPQTYVPFLEQISNQGTGDSWQKFIRDRYVTSYLRTYTENPFSILKPKEIGPEPQKNLPLTPLQQLVGASNTNTPIIVDKYPFTDLEWVSANMELADEASYDEVYNTNKVLTVYDPRDQVSNFENIYDYKTKRPVSNFSYYTVATPDILNTTQTLMGQNLKAYYETTQPTDFISTVGYVRNESPTGQLPPRTSSSILNSPIFINAILEGIDNQRNNKNYPYVKAAYLFLQSLPLATLRERYKSQGVSEPLDYIASCFNKFGAIHKVPYAWVLKLGAAWHRYKTYVNTGTDIIDSVWGDFDYVRNFDPIGNSPTRNYQFKLTRDDSYTTSVILQNVTANNVEIQTGFYPKLYNEFYYFYTGEDLFTNYTNNEIQSAINGGLQLYQFPNSSMLGVDQNGANLNLSTWSAIAPVTIKNNFTDPTNCLPPDNTVENGNYLILPSFGANLNEGLVQLVGNPNTAPSTVKNISSNPAMYNGTARCLWSAPNYGYFDMSGLTKPDYNRYLTTIDPTSDSNPALDLSLGTYSTMEEIFSVFDTKTLDIIEQEFLKYCNPVTDINYGIVNSEIGKQLVQIDATARNFQAFMIRAMKVTPKTREESKETFFNNAITEQLTNFNSQIVSIFEYDVILRNGNPSNFNRYIWQSYLSYGGTADVVDPIPFVPYTSGTLPTAGGTITLAQSRANNLLAWRQLELEVGFSTINQLRYSNSGSYITDFFVDNNIGFFNDTITILAPIIKMYATQKLANPSITVEQFKNNLSDYISKLETIQNQFLNEVLVLTKKTLPNQSQLPAPQPSAPLTGTQARLELYQVFQSLNDKWISGTDYKNKTLFEDFLFLDRASRNIGQTIILDIFGVKNMISQKGLNENMSVFTLISGLLIQNNFTVMPLPAFVDFYNIKDVEGLSVPNPQGSLQFADELWGTYRVVDYRKATPKFVCFFVGKPSEQLNLPTDQSGYGDDSFELRRESEVPLIEDINGKTDHLLSNKCVGFNVDLGIRNQNVFSQINVSQNNGLATSESIQALLDMINLTKTRNTGTQNVSLYDFYKKRSYEAEITCLGNALIQPMMYFNLRHVPMFNGPYMITEVSHQIGPGIFNTTFKGTRQSIYDLPSIENYLQSINTNLLTKIEALIVQQRATAKNDATSNLGKTGNLITNSDGNPAASQHSCGENLSGAYLNWSSTAGESQITNITQKVFADALKSKIPNDIQLQSMIYLISYVRTFAKAKDIDGEFKGFGYNLGNITLNYNYAGASQFFVGGFYTCVEVTTLRKKQSYPIAIFESLEKYIDFMVAILTPNQPRIANGALRYYVCYFPQEDISEQFYDTNRKYFEQTFGPLFQAAIDSARLNGINTDYLIEDPSRPGALNNLNTNNPSPPVCEPTTITSFSPTTGRPGVIIELLGTALQFTRSITVAGQPVDRNTFQFINSGKIKFSAPQYSGTPPPPGPIVITSSSINTPVTSTTNFVYL